MELAFIAEMLDRAAREATAVDQVSLSEDYDLEMAYQIQKLSMDRRIRRGEAITGYKLGFTSRAKMEQMGVHDMIFGVLTNDMAIQDKGVMSMSKFIHPRAEPEICFRIGKDVPGALSIAEVRQYVDAIAPAIEIIDSRYKNFKFSLEDVVADNCSSSGYVIGEWADPTDDLKDLGIRIMSEGEVKAEGSSNAILGDPWESMAAATRIGAQQGYTLRKGMVILAGAATAAFFIEKGKTIEVQIEHLGRAAFRTMD